jgi:hypothetical protein
MRRVLCGVLLLALGLAPALEAGSKPQMRAQISKRQLRKRYVARPYNVRHRKAPKAQWGAKAR